MRRAAILAFVALPSVLINPATGGAAPTSGQSHAAIAVDDLPAANVNDIGITEAAAAEEDDEEAALLAGASHPNFRPAGRCGCLAR